MDIFVPYSYIRKWWSGVTFSAPYSYIWKRMEWGNIFVPCFHICGYKKFGSILQTVSRPCKSCVFFASMFFNVNLDFSSIQTKPAVVLTTTMPLSSPWGFIFFPQQQHIIKYEVFYFFPSMKHIYNNKGLHFSLWRPLLTNMVNRHSDSDILVAFMEGRTYIICDSSHFLALNFWTSTMIRFFDICSWMRKWSLWLSWWQTYPLGSICPSHH